MVKFDSLLIQLLNLKVLHFRVYDGTLRAYENFKDVCNLSSTKLYINQRLQTKILLTN